MSAGLSLPGVLVAMALSSGVALLSIQRYESLAVGVRQIRAQAEHLAALRMAFFELARDLRRDGQAGCQRLPPVTGQAINEVLTEYVEPGWTISDTERDADGRLVRLWIDVHEPMQTQPLQIVVSSCTRLDRLTAGIDLIWSELGPTRREIHLLPDTKPLAPGEKTHHLPSLEVGPLIARRYWFSPGAEGRGALLRSQNDAPPVTLLEDVVQFSVAEDGAVRSIKLKSGHDPNPWGLSVAPRQHGMALFMVMALLLAASELMVATQRLLLDEVRLTQHLESHVQALQLAEFVLACAEAEAAGVATGSVAPFPQNCPRRPPRASAGTEARYDLQQIDPDYHGAALYRITVEAQAGYRSAVRLQSYYLAGGAAQRLAWKELDP
jgi:Tfp pilus assembly protein PilX